MAYISGAYSVTYGGVDMGQTEVGFEMTGRPAFNVIRADESGRTPIDAIQTGVEDLIVRIDFLTWSRALWGSSVPWLYNASVLGANLAGKLLVGNSGPATNLVLTPITGPAFTASPNGGVYTFTKAFPLEPFRDVFSSQRLRTRPTGFYIFGEVNASTKIATMFTVSAA